MTGTDTGVGKTLLIALLLARLRQTGCPTLALKPFYSGDRADAVLFHALREADLTLDDVLDRVRSVAERYRSSITNNQAKIKNSTLLIEGVGGLLVPLGEDFTVLDLISGLAHEFNTPSSSRDPASSFRYPRSAIPLEIVVVSRNRLGTINHTLLTVRAIQAIGIQQLKVVLMDAAEGDYSTHSNPKILAELLAPVPLVRVPFLGPSPLRVEALKKKSKK